MFLFRKKPMILGMEEYHQALKVGVVFSMTSLRGNPENKPEFSAEHYFGLPRMTARVGKMYLTHRAMRKILG